MITKTYVKFQITMPDKSKIIHEIWDKDYFDACAEVQKLFPKAKKIELLEGFASASIP